jgi:hypothetical protein
MRFPLLFVFLLLMYDVLHTNAYIMYVDSSRIFAVLNCLFNIHNDNAFVYIQYALTSLRNPMVGTSPVVRRWQSYIRCPELSLLYTQ